MPDAVASATILIVDDDVGLLRLVEKTLQREGFATATASSGGAAQEWLGRNSAQLMLLDLKLQDVEGREFVNRLAAAGRLVPFIIITGQGDERVAVEMMKRGARDYLVKDVHFVEFVPTVVRRALDQLDKEKRLAQAEEALRRSEANLAHAQKVAHVGSYEFDVSGAERPHWSEETFRILGLDPPQGGVPLQESIAKFVHPEDQDRVREEVQRMLQSAARCDLEHRIVRPDGSIRHVHSVAEPVLGPDKKVVKIVGALQDITERKKLEKEILEISEREQSRIGQDLHDGLCQHLAGIEFRLLGLKQNLGEKAKKHADEASGLAKLVRDGIEQTRTLARGLSPVMLEPDGLMIALQELAFNTAEAFRISCPFDCPAPVLLRDNAVSTHLYRIAQEAVQNAVRHGRAKSVSISLVTQQDRIVLGVKDDGVGLPKTPRPHNGMGLRVMQYRASMVGGSLAVQRDPEGGTAVVCSLHAASRLETTPLNARPNL